MRLTNACRSLGGLAQVVAILALVNVFAGIASNVGARAESQKPLHIVAFGDSLFSGYGLRSSQAFPAQLQKVLKAAGHDVVITNAGVAGDTTADGLKRIAWAVPDNTDAVILEFGANDALRGTDPKQARANLEKLIAKLQERRLPILLAGMRAPANWGDHYSEDFDAIFPDLAKKHDLILYPFFLDGVVFDNKLNQDDGMHPNPKGVAEIIKRMMPSVEQLITRATAHREAHREPQTKS
jgi:acyl-CoA thioesterase-1